MLLTGYASPDRIRRVGQTRLAGWLRNRNVRGAAGVAARAVAAARAQPIVLPGQDLAASIIAELATDILALDERLKSLDAQIAADLRPAPAGRDHPVHARLRPVPRGLAAGRRR